MHRIAPRGGRWKWSVALGLSLGVPLADYGPLLGQQPAAPAPGQAPTLPPTRVEGVPPSQTPSTTVPTPSPVNPFEGTGNQTPNTPPGTGDQGATGGAGGAGTAPLTSGGVFSSNPVTNGYQAPTSTTGTRVDVPLISTPNAIDVVPSTVTADQEATNVADIVRDVAGATRLGDSLRPDAITVRGFEVRARDYRWNGFVDPTSAPRDLANVQRIEVLKGPASFLYGSGQPAGVVNVITKKPLDKDFAAADFWLGSFNFSRTTADVNGAVNQDRTMLMRVNAAYENTDSFRQFGLSERVLAAPVFSWLIDQDTSLIVEGSFFHDRRQYDTGVPAINGVVGLVPIRTSFNEPYNRIVDNDYHASATLVHHFAEGWDGRVAVFANWHDNPSDGTVPIGNGITFQYPGFDQTTLFRQQQVIPDFREQYYSAVADLTGKFCTGPFEHRTLVGTELGWFNSTDFTSFFSDPLQPVPLPTPFGTFVAPFPSSPISVTAPVHGSPPAPLVGLYNAAYTQDRYGFYAQDMVDLTHGVKLIGGVRADIIEFSFARQFSNPIGGVDFIGYPRVESGDTYYHWVPRVGIVWEPIEKTLSVYGTYSESFDPPPGGVYNNTTALKPETGQTAEAGIKAELFDHKLNLTADGFYINKQNVVTQNSFLFATQIGEQRSQGAEVSAIGKVTDQLSLIANYAYIDSRILSDPTLNGNRFRNVPYNSANVWIRYNLIQDTCQTFGVAGGLVYQGNRTGDLANTFTLPGYTRFDAGVYYARGSLTASVYFENVFDREYYTGSVDQFTVFPGAPFNVRATVGVKF